METINEKIFMLHDEGITPSKIAQKLKVKKAVVLDILGDAAKPKGLGDVVESITEATGIKAVVEAVANAVDKDCGCAKRKESLNKLFPRRVLSDLSIEDNEFLKDFFSVKRSSVNRPLQVQLVDIYNRVFNSKRKVSNCSPCVVNIIKELKKIYEATDK